MPRMRKILLGITAMAALSFGAAGAFAANNVFTYQGRLTNNGQPANGVFDLRFQLFSGDWPLGFAQGTPIVVEDVNVTNGLFTVKLDFGTTQARWLDIGVRAGASTGSFTFLYPRTELTPAPSATSLVLPFDTAGSSAGDLFAIDQSGAGDCLSVSASGGGDAVRAHTTGTGTAVNGSTAGVADAVYGQTTGGGNAVFGYNLSTAGRAGFFRTENQSNAANTLEAQQNGTGFGVKANARTNSAGFFENTNSGSAASTLRAETNGTGLALWAKTTGTGNVAKFDQSNTQSNATALRVRNDGTGLAANFERGGVEVHGELHATMGTVLNRGTPIAFGRIDSDLISSSGNVTVTYQGNDIYQLLIVGESNPDLWIIDVTVSYYEFNTGLEYLVKPSRPYGVVGQPGQGIFYLKDECKNGCNEFQTPHYINFVVYKGQ